MVLTVLFLARQTLVPEGLLAEAVIAVTLAGVVMMISAGIGIGGRSAMSRFVAVRRFVADGLFGGFQGLVNDHG
jgi:hypothetical protein